MNTQAEEVGLTKHDRLRCSWVERFIQESPHMAPEELAIAQSAEKGLQTWFELRLRRALAKMMQTCDINVVVDVSFDPKQLVTTSHRAWKLHLNLGRDTLAISWPLRVEHPFSAWAEELEATRIAQVAEKLFEFTVLYSEGRWRPFRHKP